MKNSKDWIRQPMVDEAADAFVATGEYDVSDVTAYQVGKALGCEPNGALHAKVRDWRRRRQDQTASSAIEVPTEAEAEFGGVLDRMTGESKAVFRRTIQQVGGEVERTMMPRVVDAERRRDAAEAETDKVLELWQKTEAELSDALLKIGELEQAAVEARLREERLIGRLEQRAADWATALRHGHRDGDLPEPIYHRAAPESSKVETAAGSVAGESSSGAITDAD